MAARDWDWWYASAPDGLLMSVSQHKLFGGCRRRWGFRHLLKLREEMGAAATRGDAYHQELEYWVKLRRMPVSKPALAALRYAPAPGVAEAEVAVNYAFDGTGWLGFIDLVYDWDGEELGLGKGGIRPLCSTGHTVIHDWKFTGNLKNALTEDELRADEAANLYALEAYMGGAQRVSCRWVYVQMSGSSHPTKEVWVDMPLEAVAQRLDEMSASAEQAHQLVKLHRKSDLPAKNAAVLDMECDTGECFAFRRDCPYKISGEHTHEDIKNGTVQGCNPTARLMMPAPPGESKMQDFKTALSNFPGTKPAGGPPAIPPKTPPALPPKSAPKLPPKPPKSEEGELSDAEADALVAEHMAAQGKTKAYHNDPNPVVERGFVNSDAAPTEPPASPEEAAAKQGVKAPEAAKPIEDDLTPLNKDQLRALCGTMGIDLAKKRPTEETLRGMIRIARIQAAAGAPVPDVQTAVSPEVIAEVLEVEGNTRAEAERIAGVKKAPPTPPKIVKTETVTTVEVDTSTGATRTSSETKREEPEVRTWATQVMELHTIMSRAHEKLFEATGKRDFRHIQYTGSADLCLAVQDLFESGALVAEVVVFDSRTPEGSTLKTTLLDLARAGRFLLIDGQRL